MKSVCLAIVILSVLDTSTYSQKVQSNPSPLELGSSARKVENRISFNISERMVKSLHSTTGNKVGLNPKNLIINGDTIDPVRVNSRGQSTLMYRRKSLTVRLNSEATFQHGEAVESMMNFKLLSLSMDKYYCHNRLAFELLETVGLHHLFYSFCELRINDHSEGIFLVVERPEDWALKKRKSPVIIRRGFDHAINEIKTNKTTDQNEKKKYMENFKEIYRILDVYEGEKLYEALTEYMDVDFYMTWIAFNFLVHNGDYSDEVFFYIDPEIGKYRIIPWDYDDILVSSPHEGLRQRNVTIGGKLLFSSEDLLDIKIAKDPYLYSLYLKRLRELLETITPDVLKKSIESTFAELYPYYAEDQIISNARYDCYKDASLDNLQGYLSQIFRLLSDYRKAYLE